MANSQKRVVVLIDMDCFYVQVEQRRNPLIRGKPCAVVQYNAWKGGGIIAVGYEARAVGVTRQMRGDDAKQKCPEITLCRVPTANGKADLTRYREASAEVIKVLLQFGGLVERASIDEAYVDFTDTVNKLFSDSSSVQEGVPTDDQLQFTHVVGYPGDENQNDKNSDKRLAGLKKFMNEAVSSCNLDDARLLVAAKIVEEMRKAVFEQTSFRCSAGISHNKMLAKLACGINKPNKQTVLPIQSVPNLFRTIKVGKIRNLGGKLGKSLMSIYGVNFIGELTKISSSELIEQFGMKTGTWLHEVCRGIDHEPVKERHLAESVGCSKNFTGGNALNTRTKVKYWIEQLAKELVERLVKERDQNNRMAYGMTAHLGLSGKRHVSRVCPLERYDVDQVSRDCLNTIEQLNENSNKSLDVWSPAITMMGLSSKNFQPIGGGSLVSLMSKRQAAPKKKSVVKENGEKFDKADSEATTLCEEPKEVVDDLEDKSEIITGVSSYFQQRTSLTISGGNLSAAKATDPSNKPPRKKRTSLEAFLTPVSASAIGEKYKRNEPKASSSGAKVQPAVKKDFFTAFARNNRDILAPSKVKVSSDDAGTCLFNQHKSEDFCETNVRVDGKIERRIQEMKAQNQVKKRKISTPSATVMKKKKLLPSAPSSSYQKVYRPKDVDLDVLESLPLGIQHELRSALGMNKKPNSSNGNASSPEKVNSIQKFLTSGVEPSFKKTVPSPSAKVSSQRQKSTQGGIKNFTLPHAHSSSVPFGFFRARYQASEAIKKAIEERKMKSQSSSNRTTDDHPVEVTLVD